MQNHSQTTLLQVNANEYADTSNFILNRNESVHRWYPYVEGFSGELVSKLLSRIPKNVAVLDPFCGAGTTQLESMLNGFSSVGVDANPFMCFVAETKTSGIKKIKLSEFRAALLSFERKFGRFKTGKTDDSEYISDIFARNYFHPDILAKISNIKNEISLEYDAPLKQLFQLALASILVESSNMRRGPDLAFKKVGQKADYD